MCRDAIGKDGQRASTRHSFRGWCGRDWTTQHLFGWKFGYKIGVADPIFRPGWTLNGLGCHDAKHTQAE